MTLENEQNETDLELLKINSSSTMDALMEKTIPDTTEYSFGSAPLSRYMNYIRMDIVHAINAKDPKKKKKLLANLKVNEIKEFLEEINTDIAAHSTIDEETFESISKKFADRAKEIAGIKD
jgi:hypothetical protein